LSRDETGSRMEATLENYFGMRFTAKGGVLGARPFGNFCGNGKSYSPDWAKSVLKIKIIRARKLRPAFSAFPPSMVVLLAQQGGKGIKSNRK